MDTTVNSNTLLANREQLEAQSKANRIANGLPALDLREVVLSQHLAHSQRWHMAKMALESLEAALASLAALGHRFMAVPLQAPAIIEFPKVMYHDGLGTRTIESEAEAKALGDGWRDTPQVVEAKAPDTIAEAQRVEDARRADWPAGNPLSSEEAARRTAWDNEHRNAAPIVEFDPNRLTPGS